MRISFPLPVEKAVEKLLKSLWKSSGNPVEACGKYRYSANLFLTCQIVDASRTMRMEDL
jgi:hypothetical protein